MNENLKIKLKKIEKKIINIGLTITVGGIVALTSYNELLAHLPISRNLTREQTKIVNTLKERGVNQHDTADIREHFNTFNNILEDARKALAKGDTQKALNLIINAKGVMNEVPILDIRELKAQLLEVEIELGKAIQAQKTSKS